mmetsp:Transcript_19812/g.58968  ORF Transcript_19812/g.58968 Transcript_19812/m.58968 type:complete len:317 (-) Transcript_19812:286-1236(-)
MSRRSSTKPRELATIGCDAAEIALLSREWFLDERHIHQVAGATGFLWGAAGAGAAKLYAGSVASGTAWTLATDHVLPGGGRRVAEALGGTSVGVPCRVRDAVEKAAAAAGLRTTPTAFLAPASVAFLWRGDLSRMIAAPRRDERLPTAAACFGAVRGRRAAAPRALGTNETDALRARAKSSGPDRRAERVRGGPRHGHRRGRDVRPRGRAGQARARGRGRARDLAHQAQRRRTRRAASGHAERADGRLSRGPPRDAGEVQRLEEIRGRRRRRGRRAVDGRGRAAPARVLALRGIRRGRRGRAHGRPRGALARAGED